MQKAKTRRNGGISERPVAFSRQLGKKTLVTAGYFMQVWIDASTVNNLNQPGVGIFGPANVDDANMTMFDGFMLRVERTF